MFGERKIKKTKLDQPANDSKWAENLRKSRLEREKVFDISILGISSKAGEGQEFHHDNIHDNYEDEQNVIRTENEEQHDVDDEEDEERNITFATRGRYKKQRRDGMGKKSSSNNKRSKKRQEEETSDSDEKF